MVKMRILSSFRIINKISDQEILNYQIETAGLIRYENV